MKRKSDNSQLPSFISRQVETARRFFLNLNPDEAADLEVVCGGVEKMQSDYVIDREDFPYFGVELVVSGKGSLHIEDKSFKLQAGTVFAYGPTIPHRISNSPTDAMQKYYLDFVGQTAPTLLTKAGLIDDQNKFKPLQVGAIHELTELLEMFFRNTNEDGPLVAPICNCLIELFCLKIAQIRLPEGKSVPKSYATYQSIRQHIDQRFIELNTIQQVAEECDVTPVYLSRLFGRFSDCGAYQYLLRQKMNYAAGLMMNDGLLVREVAKRIGMPDAFQFSRAFKRVFGISPSQLAKANPNDPRKEQDK